MRFFRSRSRFAPLLALVFTVAALVTLLTRASLDTDLLAKRGLDMGSLQAVYGMLLVLLTLLLPVAPRVQAALQRRSWLVGGVLVVALVSVVMLIVLIAPYQLVRLMQMAFSQWVMTAHGVALAGLVVVFAVDQPGADVGSRLHRASMAVIAALALVLVVAHVASFTEFLSIDLPDEPWVGSMATNYAQNDDLSPSYFASSYGSPDVIFPRYYLAMGLWLKLVGNTDWSSLRLFPLLVGGLSVILFVVLLRRRPGWGGVQVCGALVTLLSLSVFLRISHNVRSDILLAVYGVLVLGCLLAFFDRPRTWVAIGLGLALFVGMESIPTVALPIGLGIGVALTLWMLVGKGERLRRLRPVALYAACSALSIAVYFLWQFLPDIGKSWSIMQVVAIPYVGITQPGTLRLPFDSLFGYIFRFSQALSPLELLVAVGAGLVVWARGDRSDRWLIVAMGCGLGVLVVLISLSFGYFVVFAPFAAYLIGRALRGRVLLALGAFVLLPALAVVPFFDLTTALRERPNTTLFADVETAVGQQIPDGIVVVGEPIFWQNLQQRTYFIGWFGMGRHNQFNQRTLIEGLTDLNVEAAICNTTLYAKRCEKFAALTDYFPRTTTFEMRGEQYMIMWHH